MDNGRISPHRHGKAHQDKGRFVKKSFDEAKRIAAVKKRRNIIIVTAVSAVTVILMLWMLVFNLFVVKKIELNGTSVQYSDKEIAEKLGFSLGDRLFSLNIDNLKKHGKYNLPQFDDIEVSISFPDKVVVNVKEAVPAMYCIYGTKGYVLSEKLRVTAEYDSVSDVEAMGLMRVIIPDVERCVAGEYIKTKSESDELLKTLYGVFKESGVAGEIVSVDITDKFDIVFEYQSRFTVKIGSAQNITVKIRAMKGIIDDLGYDENGIIDVSDEKIKEWTFKDYSKM